MRKSETYREEGWNKKDETRNPAWRTQGNEPVLDIVRSPSNQHLLLHALENSRTKIERI